MGGFNTRRYTLVRVSASFGCFLWALKELGECTYAGTVLAL